MILDTSAIAAIFLEEAGFAAIRDKIGASPFVGIGAPTLVETNMVLCSRLDDSLQTDVQTFLLEMEVTIIPFETTHWREATSAFLRFGKGRHRAKLNFGDCLSYATAKVARKPLLYVGDDFTQTDLARA